MASSFADSRLPTVDHTLGDIELHLQGYRPAIAEVLYYLPDHPMILQSFTWQTLDLAPRYPRLSKFLDYWRQHIEAVIHSVRLGQAGAIVPFDLRHIDAEFRVH